MRCSLTLWTQPQGLIRDELIGWEAVVQLDHINVIWLQTSGLETLLSRQLGHVIPHLERKSVCHHQPNYLFVVTSVRVNNFQFQISCHFNAAVLFKCGHQVGHHLLGHDLHRLVLQVVFPDKGLAGQNCCSSTIWCRAKRKRRQDKKKRGMVVRKWNDYQ